MVVRKKLPTEDSNHLRSNEELRALMRDAYYDRLHQDPQFVAELQELTQTVIDVRNRVYDRKHIDEWKRIGSLIERGAIDEVLRIVTTLPPDIDNLVRDFHRRWHLPGVRGWPDLYFAVTEAASANDIRLYASWSVCYAGPSRPIFPPMPPLIEYHPARTSRGELRAYAERLAADLVSSILKQAEALEKELIYQSWCPIPPELLGTDDPPESWRLKPPKHHDPRNLQKGANRLYLRAVKGCELKQIRRETGGSYSTISEQLAFWASTFDLCLPASDR